MSRFETVLLYFLFASSFLVEVRLPILGFSASNLVVPLAGVVLAWCGAASPGGALRSHRRLVACALAVYAWAWISAANGVRPALSLWYVAKYSAHLVVFASLLAFFHRRAAILPSQKVAYRVLIALAVLGVAEYWFPDAAVFSLFRNQPAAYPRISSLLVWPNQFAVLVAIGVAFGATLQHEQRVSRLAYTTALVPFLVALALSGSRGGWLVLTVLLLTLAALRVITSRALAAICAGFAVILITFPVPTAQLGLTGVPGLPLAGRMHAAVPQAPISGTTTPVQTLGTRLDLWRAAVDEIEQRPFTGIGLEVFANTIGPRITGQHWINTHNLFLNIATELGLIGLVLVVIFLFELGRSGDPRHWSTSLPLLGIGVGQLFDCFLYDHAFMTFTVFFAACYASLPARDEG